MPRDRPQLDFQPHGRGLPFPVAAQVLGQQIGEVGVDELGEAPADELGRARRTAELGEARVRDEDTVALHRDRLVHGLDQSPQHGFAIRVRCVLALQALHHAIDIERKIRSVLARCVRAEAYFKVAVARGDRDPVADLAQLVQLTVAPVKNDAQQRSQCRKPDQDSDQHVVIGTRHVLRPGGARKSPDPMFCASTARTLAGCARRGRLLFRFAAKA